MKILNLAPEFSPSFGGGLMPNCYYISREQAKQGHDVTVFSLTREAERQIEMEDVNIHFIKKPRLVRWFAGMSFLGKAKELGIMPDIVHSINPIPLGWLYPIARKKLETKYCLSVHSSLQATKKGGFKDLAGWLDSFEFERLCVFLGKRVDLVLPVAESVAIELKLAGIDPKKIRAIPPGVDFALFNKKTCAKKNAEFTLLFTGRFAKTKGVEYLVEAIKLLEEKHVRLILCGAKKNDNNYRNIMEKISRLGLTEKIKILPIIPHRQMPKIYQSADAFVMPSVLDQKPKAIFEAMAAGLPVIATNQSGIPEVIKDGYNGLLVETRNAGTIANAIENLMEDDALRKKISKNSIETAKEFDWKVIAKRYTNAFSSIL